jgi:hypothetical protein
MDQMFRYYEDVTETALELIILWHFFSNYKLQNKYGL